MISRLLIIFLILGFGALHAQTQEYGNESYYSDEFCKLLLNGKARESIKEPVSGVTLYPDCITENYVFEFDWATRTKMYECRGQADYYSVILDQYPACFLLARTDKEEEFARQQEHYFKKMKVKYFFLRVEPKP